MKPGPKKHTLLLINSVQKPTSLGAGKPSNPWAWNPANHWACPSSRIEIQPFTTPKIFTVKNSALKKFYISPILVQLGVAFFHPGRCSHRESEWGLGESFLYRKEVSRVVTAETEQSWAELLTLSPTRAELLLWGNLSLKQNCKLLHCYSGFVIFLGS